jgi:prevent-host-death family protein
LKTVSTGTLKARLLHYIDVASFEPIVIQKKEGPAAVIISFDEYTRLMALERNFWIQRSRNAERSGYLGVAKSTELLKAGLNEKP